MPGLDELEALTLQELDQGSPLDRLEAQTRREMKAVPEAVTTDRMTPTSGVTETLSEELARNQNGISGVVGALAKRAQIPGVGITGADISTGLEQGRNDVLTLGARLAGDRLSARSFERQNEVADGSADAIEGSGILGSSARGVTRSLVPMVLTAGLGPVPAIASGAGIRAAQAVSEAEDAGLEGSAANAYIARAGTIEALPALVFQRLGLGGAEKAVADAFKKNASDGVAAAFKNAGRQTFKGELPEEYITAAADIANQKLSDVDTSALTGQQVFDTFRDVTLQTLMMGGVAHAPSIARGARNDLNAAHEQQQSLSQVALSGLDPAQATNGQLPAETAQDAPMSITPDVIETAQRLPELLRMFGIRSAVDETTTEQERQQIARDQQANESAQVERTRELRAVGDDAAKVHADRTAEEQALRQMEEEDALKQMELEDQAKAADAAAPKEINGRAPDAPVINEEHQRFQSGMEAAASIEADYQTEIQAINARRSAPKGEKIGKDQATTLRIEALGRRDARMTEAVQQATAEGRTDVAGAGRTGETRPAVGAEVLETGGEPTASGSMEDQTIERAAGASVLPQNATVPTKATPATDRSQSSEPSLDEQAAAVSELERITGDVAAQIGRPQEMSALLSQLAPMGYRVDRSQELPAGAARKRLALEAAAKARGTTIEKLANAAQERALIAQRQAKGVSTSAKVPLFVTGRMRNELRGMGYQPNAINRLSPQEANTILENGTPAKRMTQPDTSKVTAPPQENAGLDVPPDEVTPFSEERVPGESTQDDQAQDDDAADTRQDSRLLLPGQVFTNEQLIRNQRKAEGDRTPVSGARGWRALQDESAQRDQERQEKKDADEEDRGEVDNNEDRQNAEDRQAFTHGQMGRIQPSSLTGTATATGPVKKITDIINGFADWLGMQKYTSKKLGRNAAGYYDPASGAQVLKRGNDLDVFAHETGHWLDDRFGLVADGQGGTVDVYDHELERFWPYGSSPPPSHSDPQSYRRAEGVAEWIRAWAMSPQAAKVAAPLFYARFQAAVPDPVQKRLREFGDDIRRFHHAAPLDAGAANIRDLGDAGPTMAERLAAAWRERGTTNRVGKPLQFGMTDAARVRLTDRLWPLMKAIGWAGRETGKVTQAQRAENLVRLMAGMQDKTGAIARIGMIRSEWLKDGKIQLADGVGGGIEHLAGWVNAQSAETIAKDLRDLDAFMVAQSVTEQAKNIDQQRADSIQKASDDIKEWYWDGMDALTKSAEKVRTEAEKQGKHYHRVIDAAGKVDDTNRAQATRTDADLAKTQEETGDGDTKSERRAGMAASVARERLAKRTDALSRTITGIAESVEKGNAGLRQDAERKINTAVKLLERRYNVKTAQLARISRRMEMRDAHRKARLSGQGGGTRADDQQAQRILADAMSDPIRMTRLEEGAKRYRAWADGVLRYLVDKGRMSSKSYQQIKDKNEFYVAMQRDMENLTEGGTRPVGGGKIGTTKEVVKVRKGSTRTIENPLTSLMENTAKAVEEADRNEALRSVVDLLREARGMHDANKDATDIGSVAVRMENPSEGTVKVFRNGEVEHWKFAPEIQEAIKGLGEQYRVPWIMSILPTLVRTGIVKSPPFAIRNRIRDTVARLIIGQNQAAGTGWAKRLLEQVPVVGRKLTGNQITDEKKAIVELAGGAFAGHYLRSRNDWQKETNKRVKELRQDKNTIVVGLRNAGSAYNKMIESSEFAGRADEFWNNFEKLRADGIDEMNAVVMAARASRDLVDFGVSGTWVGTLNQVTPFLNAAVQGIRSTIRAAKRDPGGFAARWAMFSVIPSLLAYGYAAMGSEDDWEEYTEMPSWRRDLFWNFKVAGMWISIPKPFELGVTGSGVERGIEAAHRIHKGEDAADATARAFDGFGGSLAKSMIPVEADSMVLSFGPLIETFLANKSFYTGKDIVPQYEKDKPVADRTGARFSSRLGQLGSFLSAGQLDPRQVDHLTRGIFGQLGGLALDASDVGREDKAGGLSRLLAKSTGLSGGVSPDQQVSVSRFTGEEAATGRGEGKAMKAIQEMKREYWKATSSDDREKIAEAMRDYASGKDPLMAFDRAVTASNQLLSAWRKLEGPSRLEFAKANREVVAAATRLTALSNAVNMAKKAGKTQEQIQAIVKKAAPTIDMKTLATATKAAKSDKRATP